MNSLHLSKIPRARLLVTSPLSPSLTFSPLLCIVVSGVSQHPNLTILMFFNIFLKFSVVVMVFPPPYWHWNWGSESKTSTKYYYILLWPELFYTSPLWPTPLGEGFLEQGKGSSNPSWRLTEGRLPWAVLGFSLWSQNGYGDFKLHNPNIIQKRRLFWSVYLSWHLLLVQVVSLPFLYWSQGLKVETLTKLNQFGCTSRAVSGVFTPNHIAKQEEVNYLPPPSVPHPTISRIQEVKWESIAQRKQTFTPLQKLRLCLS